MKTAVLGFGTVGKEVVRLLGRGNGLTLGWVLTRPGKAKQPWQTEDLNALLQDRETQAVVEVMGGVEPAFSMTASALRAGKHVVTANKALVAAHGLELAALAREKGVGFLFTAACGGALPFLRHLSLARQSEGGLMAVGGILNGTSNFILSRIQDQGASFEEALAQAQALGFAEADPTDDLNGMDALRKLTLACGVAFHRMPREGTLREGIEAFSRETAADLKRRGLVCRLAAQGGLTAEDKLLAWVEPTLFAPEAPEYSVGGSRSLAWVRGKSSGDLFFCGQGAGGAPTASNVVRDLISLTEGKREMLPPGCRAVAADNGGILRRYYLRLPSAQAALAPEMTEVRHDEGFFSGFLSVPIPAEAMHQTAARLRSSGTALFFAGMEATSC